MYTHTHTQARRLDNGKKKKDKSRQDRNGIKVECRIAKNEERKKKRNEWRSV